MTAYTAPMVTDLGNLENLTLAEGSIGSPDGIEFTVQAGVGDVVEVSVGVLP
jgi:hypothetical protein